MERNKLYNTARSEAFDLVNGVHNLTSDEEPEEMLMVKRKKVQELVKKLLDKRNSTEMMYVATRAEYEGGIIALHDIFGDKCLPDKEPSAQGEPKFKVGDKVRYLSQNHEIGEVAAYFPDEKFCYSVRFGKEYHIMAEHQLEPYTEPESRNLSQETANCDKHEDNQLKDNMEEKELNLCELLKGCEKETFYSPMLSDVFIVQIRETSIHIVPCDDGHSERSLFIDKCGVWAKGGQCVLYPSRALYEKYPLDAKRAWQIWAEERKPKQWRAEKGEHYWNIDSTCGLETRIDRNTQLNTEHYQSGNYFRTKDEANQAAEAVRECLAKFHEKNIEK